MKINKEKMKIILEIVCDMTNEPVDGDLGVYHFKLNDKEFFIDEFGIGLANYKLMEIEKLINWFEKNCYIHNEKVAKIKKYFWGV